jgi:hypothetical protein
MNDYLVSFERSFLAAFASNFSHVFLAVRFAAFTCGLGTAAASAAAVSTAAASTTAVSACEFTLAVSVFITTALVSSWHN